LVALKIDVPGLSDPIRVVRNNEHISWCGETWVAFPFELEEIGEESKGEVPQVNLRVSNISRQMESYLQTYDQYNKVNGFSPITVTIYVLNSKNLASGVAEAEHLFELIQPRTDSRWATFRLGAANPFNKRFPKHRIMKSHCRFVFKGALCGYSGTETECDKSLTRCEELGRKTSFGGFPGVGMGGIRML
jgi:phage-related protein